MHYRILEFLSSESMSDMITAQWSLCSHACIFLKMLYSLIAITVLLKEPRTLGREGSGCCRKHGLRDKHCAYCMDIFFVKKVNRLVCIQDIRKHNTHTSAQLQVYTNAYIHVFIQTYSYSYIYMHIYTYRMHLVSSNTTYLHVNRNCC